MSDQTLEAALAANASLAILAENQWNKALEAAAEIIDARCAKILSKQTPSVDPLSFSDSVNLNLRMIACELPEVAAAIRALKRQPAYQQTQERSKDDANTR